MSRRPLRVHAPTPTPPRPGAPADPPSYSASSRDSFVEHPPQAGVRPRQLRLGKAHCLAHLLRDLLVGVPLDVVQPHHGARGLREALERALEIDAQRDTRSAPHPRHRLLVELLGLPHLLAADPHERLRRRYL